MCFLEITSQFLNLIFYVDSLLPKRIYLKYVMLAEFLKDLVILSSALRRLIDFLDSIRCSINLQHGLASFMQPVATSNLFNNVE